MFCENYGPCSRVYVYGLSDSIRASRYPMSTDTNAVGVEGIVTDTVRKLANCPTGTGHDQFLTGILVQFDLKLSMKAWVEAERYHWLDFVSSQSTMHRLSRMDVRSQCNRYVDPRSIAVVEELVQAYKEDPSHENKLRMLYNVPSGFQLSARMTTNYRQLKTIYGQRRNHTLDEWKEFCKWIESLPNSELITGNIKEAE